MTWEVRQGDCLSLLRAMPASSVQCVVTSPPYWGLRDYGTATWEGGDVECDHLQRPPRWDKTPRPTAGRGRGGAQIAGMLPAPYRDMCGKCGAKRIDSQLGLEPTPDQYVENMVAVFREVRRVLRDDGCVFLNLGDSYYGGGRREDACGTSDIEPEDSRARDCLCGSLCGACRVAYQTGKAHNDGLLVPTPTPSPSDSIRDRRESAPARPPTSDSARPVDHNGAAIRGQQQTPVPAGVQPLASQASMPGESSQPRQDQSRQSDMPSACRLCGRSLDADAQVSAHKSACTCGTSATQLSSADRSSGTESSGAAYPYSTMSSRLKPKDLVGIPWRVAFALQADGWWLRSDIVWAKPNPMPESVTDRPTRSHEYIFLLTKSARYFYDANAVREDLSPMSRSQLALADRDGVSEAARPKPSGRLGGPADYALTRSGAGSRGAAMNPAGRNKRSVWTVATHPFPGAHFAVFPPKLIEPCILAGSAEGDTILDPFCGSGTTGVVALRHNRSFVGLELNPEYVQMARYRITDDAPLLNAGLEVAA